MVHSVNGDRGSSVLPIGGDDYMFLGRGKHVIVDGNDVKMSGSSGTNIVAGIENSGVEKLQAIQSTSASMKLALLEQMENADDYLLACNSGWSI